MASTRDEYWTTEPDLDEPEPREEIPEDCLPSREARFEMEDGDEL